MIWLLIIGLIVFALYQSNLGGSSPVTIDRSSADKPFYDEIKTGQSEPAQRKPTPTPEPVVQSTPADVESNFNGIPIESPKRYRR